MVKENNKKDFFLPLTTFLVLMLFTAFLWMQSIKNQEVELQKQMEISGRLTAQEFRSIVKSDINRLENLKSRLEVTNGSYYDYWEHDAEMILSQNPSFKFIEWIDSSMVIRKIRPVNGNEAALNLDISKIEYRRDEWINHSTDSSANITPWAVLTQGGNAFLVDVPVYFRNKFQGTITAGMDFRENFDKFASDLQDYSIEVKDEKGTVFYRHNYLANDTIKKDFLFEYPFAVDELDGQDWSFSMFPASNHFLRNRNLFTSSAFILGLPLSFLISLLIYFYLRAKKETAKVKEANLNLTRLNKKLSKERKRAEKASKAKTEFLSNMSHEIRTPLNAILGFIQILKSNDLKENDREYLRLMHESSKNLLSLVNDILDIDRIESGEIELKKEHFQPSKNVKDLIHLYAPNGIEKRLYINTHLEEPYGTYVISDESKFNQIITNILRNALKFTYSGGIDVHYQEKVIGHQLQVSIAIEDTGIGIPKNKLKSIFYRFTQLDSSLKKKHEGGGLGLAITNNLVKLMGGSISVESEVDKGSAFKVFIPFDIAEDKNGPKKQRTEKILDLSHLKVLIVDDNRINVLVLSKILGQFGIAADVAENGQSAIKKVQETVYQLILMDIHMPGMDGFEATQLIREKFKEVVIFGFSANVTLEAINKALKVGMNDYITKPFSKERLHNLLAEHF